MLFCIFLNVFSSRPLLYHLFHCTVITVLAYLFLSPRCPATHSQHRAQCKLNNQEKSTESLKPMRAIVSYVHLLDFLIYAAVFPLPQKELFGTYCFNQCELYSIFVDVLLFIFPRACNLSSISNIWHTVSLIASFCY